MTDRADINSTDAAEVYRAVLALETDNLIGPKDIARFVLERNRLRARAEQAEAYIAARLPAASQTTLRASGEPKGTLGGGAIGYLREGGFVELDVQASTTRKLVYRLTEFGKHVAAALPGSRGVAPKVHRSGGKERGDMT